MSVYTQLFENLRRTRDAARFPNRAVIVDASRRGRAPSSRERGNEKNAFFSEFGAYFASVGRALARSGKPRSDFLEFGFGEVSEFFRLLTDRFSGEIWLATPSGDSDALLALPSETALALVLAGLDYDLGALCANRTLARDAFDSGAGTLSELERDLLSRDWRRTIAFFPDLASKRVETTDKAPWTVRRLSEIDDPAGSLSFSRGYWEARAFRAVDRIFRWATLWNAESLLGARLDASPASATSPSPASPSAPIRREGVARRPVVVGRSASEGEPGEDEALVEAIIARGEISAAEADALKPGEILPTDVPANRLFDVYIDGRLSYKCRPGVYRNGAAAMLIDLDEGEE